MQRSKTTLRNSSGHPTIAVVFEYPTLNGGERSMLQTIGRSDAGAVRVVALAPPEGRLADRLTTLRIPHFPVEWRDEQGFRLPREEMGARLIAAIEKASVDLLHANSLSMGRLTGSIADQVAIPCIAHLRDIIKLSRAAIADLNRNHALIAVSHATRSHHVRQGLCADRVTVIHNGIDGTVFQPRPRTGSLALELGQPKDRFLILTIGQLGLRKGQDVLAAAVPRIVAQVANAEFVVVGERNSTKDESKQFEKAIHSTFASYGLADRLHMLGYREDIPRLLNEADLLVHPAKQEPLGRVLLEAGAAGLPIVATRVGGTDEIVTDGISARLVPPNQAAALAEAVVELAADPVLRREFAEQARRQVLRNFDPALATERLMSIWNDCLQSPKHAGE